ncbi:MAG: carboxypeptidase-like regulatory domain-containing protein [Sphingobacteriaceae bacterium]|nr:carboxypeptidase-like regulatory domain-containing protein [Sphingobacteriaceae bacterium]
MKFTVIITFLLLLSLQGFSYENNKGNNKNNKSFCGKIIDTNGQEISGATIRIVELDQTYFSNLEGQYTFALQNNKEYTLSIEVLGYLPKQIKSTELHLFSDIQLSSL